MNPATIEAAQLGDRAACSRLLGELQDRWFRFACGLLGDPERSAEAVQETAVRFLRALPEFRGAASLSTWSMGIVLNVAREMRRRGDTLPAEEPDARVDPGPPPDVAAESADDSRQLRGLVAHLPDRQREAVMLRYFENLSVDETAVVMNCAPGTVKATVFQALRSLKRQLGRDAAGRLPDLPGDEDGTGKP